MLAILAISVEVGLGALAATDAGAAGELAWVGTVISVTILALGLLAGSSGAIQCSLAVGAALLLLRHDDRLLLAPLYGAWLLTAGELAQRSVELRGRQRIERGAVGPRLIAVVVLAALGGCAGALAAIAVTIAPGRSVALSSRCNDRCTRRVRDDRRARPRSPPDNCSRSEHTSAITRAGGRREQQERTERISIRVKASRRATEDERDRLVLIRQYRDPPAVLIELLRLLRDPLEARCATVTCSPTRGRRLTDTRQHHRAGTVAARTAGNSRPLQPAISAGETAPSRSAGGGRSRESRTRSRRRTLETRVESRNSEGTAEVCRANCLLSSHARSGGGALVVGRHEQVTHRRSLPAGSWRHRRCTSTPRRR